jgi:glutamate carboxypeptidase
MNPDSKAKPICFSAHMDTVHPVGLFGEEVVRLDENNIYGPGVLDCKGGIVQALMAMHALELCGFNSRPIKLILQSDEEVGSRTSEKRTVKFMCEEAKDAEAFINLEGSSPDYVILQRKGIVYYTFRITGIEAHSSLCAVRGANAILEAAHKIIELEKIKDHDGVTCNCGVINGGSVPNTVPGECSFCVNIRYVDSEQLEWVTKRVEEIAATVYVKGCTTTLERTGYRVAMEICERNVELLKRINTVFSENGFSTLKLGKGHGGSDASDVTAYGIPCIDSLGVTGGDIHSVNEFGNLESLKEYTKRIAAIAYCLE